MASQTSFSLATSWGSCRIHKRNICFGLVINILNITITVASTAEFANLGKTFNVVLWKAPVGFTGHIYRQSQSSFKCWYQLLSKEIHTVSFVQMYVVTLNCDYVQKNNSQKVVFETSEIDWRVVESHCPDPQQCPAGVWSSPSTAPAALHPPPLPLPPSPGLTSSTLWPPMCGAANISHICRYKAWWWL